MLRRRVAISIALVVTCAAACSSTDGRELPAPGPDQTATISTEVTAAASADPAPEAEGADALGGDDQSTGSGSGVVTFDAGDAAGSDEAGSDEAGSEGADEVHSEEAFDMTLLGPWGEQGAIPAVYTCDGSNTSPELSWAGLPSETVETAVIVTDLDAEGFVHWVVYSIDPSITNLALGQVPEGVSQAVNSFGNAGFDGPCPPRAAPTRT
ncbi:MAG: YbhB/YbcL family Raf kinase inhibitor-like protein [Ilumatobacteraceae bacterium]